MLKHKKAQVVVFDAFLFLIACSLVSTSLLMAAPTPEVNEMVDPQRYLDKAHMVFLRSTLDTSPYVESGYGRVTTVSRLALEMAIDDQRNWTGVAVWMEKTLRGLVPAGMNFQWMAICGSDMLSIGNDPQDDPMNLWVSRISVPVPVEGGELIQTLMAWRA